MTYTDHPDADIRTHRRNAQLTRFIGIGGFVVAVAFAWTSGSPIDLLWGIAWAGWANWAATDLEKQALEWEHEADA